MATGEEAQGHVECGHSALIKESIKGRFVAWGGTEFFIWIEGGVGSSRVKRDQASRMHERRKNGERTLDES